MLADHIQDHIKLGSQVVSLGIQKMPEDYALMLDADKMYYYWLRDDGAESVIHWNRWAVYRWAKKDKEENPKP